MKYLRFLGLIIIASQSLTALAQTGSNPSASNPLMPSLNNVSPPSPNVSALNKFGDIPVGPSTGIPQVTVPIYTWSNKNFGKDINISLDYHAGGIKVDEMASDVGLGWALNAGGVVSRTVKGIYDEYPIDGFLYKTMPATKEEGNAGEIVNNRLFNKMNAGLMDTQNDLFNYSFNGRNGRFVLGKNNDLLMLEQAKLKIIPTITNNLLTKSLITKISIIDEEGFTYVFSDCEITENHKSLVSSKYTSSWYLTEIIHPSGKDKITFQYEDFFLINETSPISTWAFPITNPAHYKTVNYGGGWQESLNCKRITRITFPDGNQVDFAYKAAIRQDTKTGSTAKLLDKITITKGSVKKGFKLNQDYSLGQRATLLSVTEFGGASETLLKPFTFNYFSSATLPPRFSAQQDHWGYANMNSGALIPHEYFRAPGGQFPPYRESSGGNRDTDPNRVKAGSLEKITYPTGGYTVFEMEANTAKDNWLEQNLPVTIQLPPYTDRSLNEPLNSNNNPAAQVPFTFQGENNTTTNFKLTVTPDGSGSASGVKFELYNSSNQIINTQQINFSANNVNPIERSFSLSNLVKNASYYFKIYTINLSEYYNYAQIDWREVNQGSSYDTVLRHVQPYVGGIRAKRVLDYSENGTSPIVKEYEYTMEDGVTSSGSLGIRPVYTYLVSYDFWTNPELPREPLYRGNPANPNYIIRTSGGVHPAIFVNGSPVTYKRVVEKLGQNGNYLGKTIRYFTNFNDSAPYISEDFPFIPPQYSPWQYGILKREEVYNGANQVIRTKENTFELISDSYASDQTRVENFRSIIISPVQFLWEDPHGNFSAGINPLAYPYYFFMSNVTPIAGRNQILQTKVTESEPGQTPVITTTNYTYDAANYYLKQASLIDSRNREVKTVLNYPKDMVTANIDASIYQGMIDKNIISPVIEEKVSVGGIQQTARTTKYAKWNNNFYAPERVKTKKMALTEEDRIIYLQYDSHAAPLSVQQATGPKVSYIWSYGGMHLLAQVANAEYSQVQTLLGGAAAIETFRNKTAPTDAEIDAFLAPLVNGLPAEASILRFKHDTLRGLTGQLDEAGRKTSYEYDEFNRLKAVRDQQGNLVEEYKYNYRNQ